MTHIRANLLLLAFTVVICCVLYPLVMYASGRALFPIAASGSLVNEKGDDATGGARGSRLIAQPFTSDEYFWPRPSAVSYNATASGGSNWGASNPKLRDRVCQQLGPIIVYKKGSRSAGSGPDARTPQQDIEAWAAGRERPPADANVHGYFFDAWLSDPANKDKAADIETAPVDMVTASGSGLDPHVTLRNALCVYQLDRVAKKRAASPADVETVKQRIADVMKAKSFTPLSGLIGEPLVNVLELNTELDKQFPLPPAR